jgi:hypothetical protein
MLVSASGNGIYAAWTFSSDTTGIFPDRNLRFNYYDLTFWPPVWVLTDTCDFMASGQDVFPKRAGHGNVDDDPVTKAGVVSGHVAVGADIMPWVARDEGPGSGIFDYSDSTGLGPCQWPVTAVGQDGTIHVLAVGDSGLVYAHATPDSWPMFSELMTDIGPNPAAPTHNIAASKVSDKVTLVWEVSGSMPQDAYVMTSTDGGATWGNGPTLLDLPLAFGGDTVTSCHSTSLFAFYDVQDRLHIVANLSPLVHDTLYFVPSQIWHYCPDNETPWSRICVASCAPGNLRGTLDAPYACRPSIGQDSYFFYLYVVWEEFDSTNVDTATGRLRADIFCAHDRHDNGRSWTPALRVSTPGPWSCRFPSAIDYFDDDTFRVLYMIDGAAGSFVQGDGQASHDPIVVCKPYPDAIEEGGGRMAPRAELTVLPNPFKGETRLDCSAPTSSRVEFSVRDMTGREVAELFDGLRIAGRHVAHWNGTDGRGHTVPAGVYFVQAVSRQPLAVVRSMVIKLR